MTTKPKPKPAKIGRPPRNGDAPAGAILRLRMTAREKKLVQRVANKVTDGDMSAAVRYAIQQLAEKVL